MRYLKPKQWADLIKSGHAALDDVPDTPYKNSTVKQQVMEMLKLDQQPSLKIDCVIEAVAEPEIELEPEPGRLKRTRRITE